MKNTETYTYNNNNKSRHLKSADKGEHTALHRINNNVQ